jgi:hypothetical protein
MGTTRLPPDARYEAANPTEAIKSDRGSWSPQWRYADAHVLDTKRIQYFTKISLQADPARMRTAKDLRRQQTMAAEAAVLTGTDRR